MRPALNNHTKIDIHESGLNLVDGDGWQQEVLNLKVRLENEIHYSQELKASLAERDLKIAGLEQTLK